MSLRFTNLTVLTGIRLIGMLMQAAVLFGFSLFPAPSATYPQEPQLFHARLTKQETRLTRNQRIRFIDFNKVAYPRYPEYSLRKKKYVMLKPGKGGPAELNYGDVTGDGVEEALMMLGIESSGSAPQIVYIFGLRNGKQRVLWFFETGDRADGGLRQAYADHGNLVIE